MWKRREERRVRRFIVRFLRRAAVFLFSLAVGITIDVVCGSPWPIATAVVAGVTLAFMLPHDGSGDMYA